MKRVTASAEFCETARLGDGFNVPAGAHALYGLDPRIVADLKLARHGLKFAPRDMPLVALRPDGKHLAIGRDPRATARAIAAHSRPDAEAWPGFRRETFALARALRPRWWEGRVEPAPPAVDSLRRQSLASWLDGQFESDALKAALAVDAAALSPLVPGAPLLLLWRAAQEMCGLQGAVAAPMAGPAALVEALTASAKALGVEIRTGARVSDFVVNEGAVTGVILATGETIATRYALASLSRLELLATRAGRAAIGIAEAGGLERAAPGVASAKVMLALNAPPAFGGAAVPLTGRFIFADRIESIVAAHGSAHAGRMPEELVMEAVFPAAADASLAPIGQHVVSILIKVLPRRISGGWDAAKAQLAAKAIAALDRFAPGLARHVTAAEILTPDDIAVRYGEEDLVTVERMLSDGRGRILSPIRNLLFCGASAEPAGAVSGRAGRLAADFVLQAEAAR